VVKFVNGENGLKCFSRSDCDRMIVLIDFALADKKFAFVSADWCLVLKAKLLRYIKMNWREEIRIPAKIDRSSF